MVVKKTRLERIAELLGSPFFAASYIFFTCIQAIRGGYNQAKAESLPDKEDPK